MNRAPHAFVLVAFLTACATPRVDAIRSGDRIIVAAEPDRYGNPVEITIANRNIGKGAGIGAGTGAALGVLGSLACGPFFFLCATAIGTAAMGAGALAGAAVGAASGLAGDAEAAILEKAREHAREDLLRTRLASTVRERLQGRWTVVEADAPTRLLVRLESVTLDVDAEHRLALSMYATVTIERAGQDPRERSESMRYLYRGVAHHPEVWAEDRDGLMSRSLDIARAHIADAIYAELAR